MLYLQFNVNAPVYALGNLLAYYFLEPHKIVWDFQQDTNNRKLNQLCGIKPTEGAKLLNTTIMVLEKGDWNIDTVGTDGELTLGGIASLLRTEGLSFDHCESLHLSAIARIFLSLSEEQKHTAACPLPIFVFKYLNPNNTISYFVSLEYKM